jgi:hypothetical protein
MAEILSFRWVVCGLNAQELESTYAKAAKLLDQSQGSDVDEVVALLRSVLPPSEQFREGFRQARMGVKYVTRYVLASIERALNPAGELKPSDQVHIEHIMPQARTEYWEQRVEDEDIVTTWREDAKGAASAPTATGSAPDPAWSSKASPTTTYHLPRAYSACRSYASKVGAIGPAPAVTEHASSTLNAAINSALSLPLARMRRRPRDPNLDGL